MHKEISMTLENVSVNYDVMRKTTPTWNVYYEASSYPRGTKLPKKKRIRNKWIKKYHTVHELNCIDVDFEFE